MHAQTQHTQREEERIVKKKRKKDIRHYQMWHVNKHIEPPIEELLL